MNICNIYYSFFIDRSSNKISFQNIFKTFYYFFISLADLVLSKDLYLSSIEESILLNILEERTIFKGYASDMTSEVRENRFVLIVGVNLYVKMVLIKGINDNIVKNIDKI